MKKFLIATLSILLLAQGLLPVFAKNCNKGVGGNSTTDGSSSGTDAVIAGATVGAAAVGVISSQVSERMRPTWLLTGKNDWNSIVVYEDVKPAVKESLKTFVSSNQKNMVSKTLKIANVFNNEVPVGESKSFINSTEKEIVYVEKGSIRNGAIHMYTFDLPKEAKKMPKNIEATLAFADEGSQNAINFDLCKQQKLKSLVSRAVKINNDKEFSKENEMLYVSRKVSMTEPFTVILTSKKLSKEENPSFIGKDYVLVLKVKD